ncbi:hypothetical protein P872_19630 [Rhodonellum psychrophilum GCM71 = DSM 17998]|uniref:S-adenosylmethionine synthetase n=2 Tax=Rhodonellum TaxID=336827 RepID=U5BMH7_9BACT|nr:MULTISPECIES: methionine adenosyltransferase [Rhodonellum]ERM81710.1 hypothetical protein P872_19630 [Rhodonellum psychrophilum GCM71 = DSM 17998]SDY83772.1 S-adenosylmethionine synthetase [Rhodonellum ikkaensis]
MAILISRENFYSKSFEVAETKGLGHPDTICDQITEQISRALCRFYLTEFGSIQHHNVDKALLIGGQSEPIFNGGKILQPISLVIAGRATHQAQDKSVPVEEIAIQTAKQWLAKNIRNLNVETDIQIISKIRKGSIELVELFNRFGKGEIPLANDTSFGVGYYPLSFLENNILKIERLLNHPLTKVKFPFIGEDIKVMGVKNQSEQLFTVAIAMVDRHISDLSDYISKIEKVKTYLKETLNLGQCSIDINTADDYERESIYLTVSGTSAESGDDGQVGRGNRINGLISPYRPMSLEAASGKNPVSHIGKIYNYFAMDLSRSLVENHFASQAYIYIVSQIGKPITEPQLLHIQIDYENSNPDNLDDFVKEKLLELPRYWRRIIEFKD